MPRRKFYKKRRGGYSKKKRYSKRKNFKKGNPTTLMIRNPLVVPDRIFVKLRYNEIINKQTATNFEYYEFAGNDVYDPNVTSTGTQPTGYDQWSAFYTLFRVHASKIKIAVSSQAGTHTQIVGIVPQTASAALAGINEAARDPRARTKQLAASANNVVYLSNYLSSKKAFGERQLDDIVYSGTTGNVGTGASPSRLWYWSIFLATVDGANAIDAQLHVKVTYYVELYKRVDLNTS